MTPVPKKNRRALLVTMLELRSLRRAPGNGWANSWGHGLGGAGAGPLRDYVALTVIAKDLLARRAHRWWHLDT
jgi:hypothetical protein